MAALEHSRSRSRGAGGRARRRSRARLLNVSPKFISRAPRSECAGRYARGTRAHAPDFYPIYETDRGRLAHPQGSLHFALTRPARSARSPHTYRRPFPSGIPPRSTRVCGQTGQGLRGWQRGRLRPLQIFRRGHGRGCRMRPCSLANGAHIGLCMCMRLSIP